ncbi:MAG: hypothetical protein EFT35_00955 [Methanophagales archaeon ANME-1-THS]|nr:MAG: hypothetical protein EFT35_00955 [Methanophagales archaeon ANME-1-THS]
MAGTKQVTLDTCEHTSSKGSGDAISPKAELQEPHLESPLAFPFEWKYAVITELNEAAKKAVVRKGCDLCNQKKVEFQKVSSGIYKSFLCRACAENYVRAAMSLKTS